MDGAETTQEVSPSLPTQTTIMKPAPNSCPDRAMLDLASTGPYIPFTIDQRTYNLAIAFDEDATYIFSDGFCFDTLPRADSASCYPSGAESSEVLRTSSDDGSQSLLTGAFGFKFDYGTFSLTTQTGILFSKQSMVMNNYPLKIVTKLSDGDPNLFEERYGSGNIHGIIGLKGSSDFVRYLAQACNQSASFAVNLQAGAFLSIGSLDTSASIIGSPDSIGRVLNASESYDATLLPAIPGGFAQNVQPKKKKVFFDPVAEINIVPNDIMSLVEPGFAPGSNLTLTLSGIPFTVPWSAIADNVDTTNNPGTVVLGAPFFQYVYTVLTPNSGMVFAQLLNAPNPNSITPFSATIYGDGEPSGTESGGGVATTTATPSSSGTGTNNNPNTNINTVNVSSSKAGLPIGAIVGAVVGGVVLLFVLIFAICCFVRRRKVAKNAGTRGVEKQYEADFDAEIAHHEVGFFPNFTKESGYASLPTPPPPPSAPQVPPLNMGPGLHMYDSQTEYSHTQYTPTLGPYHDESPSRSLNTTPLPVPSEVPTIMLPSQHQQQQPMDRRLSMTPSLDLPSPLSRNVSAVSRRGYPGISHSETRMSRSAVTEEDDNYDAVSMTSGPVYNPRGQPSQDASSSAPRLPFNRFNNESRDF
ncbi:hypothetical protein H072_10270 [Dactylellina haptotyla CBS 200.50]|uniref:Uncharacterized protein n=1 Tax=Dactylellina haptotyla (strain CBS 200.50) TaxID=1284197 RepID=S8BAJ8_DACHA|nr:hypothetical protein H072_10270 [Dactylellina haptotyla CBS 200.50]